MYRSWSILLLASLPGLCDAGPTPLRKLCIEAPVVVVATPVDPLVPTVFRVKRVLRSTGKLRLAAGDTVAPAGLDPARVRTTEEADPAAKEPVPRAIEQALLFLEPGATGGTWKLLPTGFRFCAADGKLLAPSDSTNTPAVSRARWAVVLRRVLEDVATLAKLDALRAGRGRPARRVEALLAWVEAHRGEFAAVSAGSDESPNGWDRLQFDVFDWVFAIADPEDALRAARLYASFNGGEAPRLQTPAFATPEGRAVLLREVADARRLSADRVRAADLLTQRITAWPDAGEQRLGARPLSLEEQESTLGRLAALLSEKDDALRAELARAIARLADPEGRPARRSTKALDALAACYKDAQPGPARDELALTLCRLAPPSRWKALTSNPPGVCAVLGDVVRSRGKTTFWLTLRSGGGVVYEPPTLLVERFNGWGFVAETTRVPLSVLNLEKGWSVGWNGTNTLAAQLDLEAILKPGTLYRIRVEGFVGKGKDRQKWLSEPRKIAVPALKPSEVPGKFATDFIR